MWRRLRIVHVRRRARLVYGRVPVFAVLSVANARAADFGADADGASDDRTNASAVSIANGGTAHDGPLAGGRGCVGALEGPTPSFVAVGGAPCDRSPDIATAGGVVSSQREEVIVIMHQCACTGHGKTIHSAIWEKTPLDTQASDSKTGSISTARETASKGKDAKESQR